MKKVQASSSVLFSAFKMALGTLGSRVLGLVRDILIASSFNPVITDAWLVAFRIPNLFRRLFGEGALSVSFLPLLVESREKQGEAAEKQFVDQVFSFLFFLLGSSSVLCFIFAPQIVGLIAGGEAYTSIAGKVEYTIRFLRIMSGFLLFICLFAFFMALLNSRKKFFTAAIAPAILNVCLIVACFLPRSIMEIPGEWLSWMALLGGFLQMLLLVPAVIRQGLLPKLNFSFFTPDVKRVLRNATPAMLSMGVLQITTMVNVYYASTIENGANTWIYLADRLLELPLSLIAVSFASALLPSLAESWSKDDKQGFGFEFQKQLQFTLFLAVPAGVGLFLLGEPLSKMLFQRGEFTDYATMKTASVVQVYAFSLVLYASIRIVNVCFYAAKKVWMPILGTSIALTAHLIMVPFLVERWGVVGLAMSTALSGLLNLICQVAIYSREFGFFKFRGFVKSISKTAVSAGVMCCLLLVFQRFQEDFSSGHMIHSHLVLIAMIGLSVLIYFLFAYLLKMDELAGIRRRLKRG